MGFLAPLATGIGAAAGAGGAGASLGFGALSTGLGTAAQLAGGFSALSQARYASRQASEGAENTRLAGQFEESVLKGKYTALGATQKVAQAANGVDVNSRSAVALRDATADVGALDAATLHYNAMREAFGLDEQARLYKKAGVNAAIGGALKAGGTLLSGASALGDKWRQYKTSGAL